ncbi:hypothetical protein CapIbe_012081 [Capra ibex]
MTRHLCHYPVSWIQRAWKRIDHKCLSHKGHGTPGAGGKSSMKYKVTDITLPVCEPVCQKSKAKDKQMSLTPYPKGAQRGLGGGNSKVQCTFVFCHNCEKAPSCKQALGQIGFLGPSVPKSL